jgi:hypothetical protein
MDSISKSLSLFLILALAISSLSVVVTIQVGLAQSGTNVSSIISSDTTWTKAGSPYNLTGPIGVSKGVTLTIEAGVTVNLNTYSIDVNGTLNAQGSNVNNLVFISDPNPNNYAQEEKVTAITLESQSSGLIENAILNSASIYSQNSVILNNNTFNGLVSGAYWSTDAIINLRGSSIISNNIIRASVYVAEGSSIIINNTIIGAGIGASGSCSVEILNNTLSGGGDALFGIHLTNPSTQAVVSDNYISSYKEACISIENIPSVQVQRNIIHNNLSIVGFFHPFGIEIRSSSPLIENNTIAGNLIGLDIYNSPTPPSTESHPTITNNNIYDNTEYNIYLGFPDGFWYLKGSTSQASNVEASNNWWGTTDLETINQTIYDSKNQSNLGVVNFVPILTALNPKAIPDPNAPIPTLNPSASPLPSPTTSSTSTSGTPTPTPSVPEFPTWAALLLVIIVTLPLIAFKTKQSRR